MWRQLGLLALCFTVARAYEPKTWKRSLENRIRQQIDLKQHQCYTVHMFGVYTPDGLYKALDVSRFRWHAKVFTCEEELDALLAVNAANEDFLDNYPNNTFGTDLDKSKIVAVFSTIMLACTDSCFKPNFVIRDLAAGTSSFEPLVQNRWCQNIAPAGETERHATYTDMQFSVGTFVTNIIATNNKDSKYLSELTVHSIADSHEYLQPPDNLRRWEKKMVRHFSTIDMTIRGCEGTREQPCEYDFSILARNYIFDETLLASMQSQCMPTATTLDAQKEQDTKFAERMDKFIRSTNDPKHDTGDHLSIVPELKTILTVYGRDASGNAITSSDTFEPFTLRNNCWKNSQASKKLYNLDDSTYAPAMPMFIDNNDSNGKTDLHGDAYLYYHNLPSTSFVNNKNNKGGFKFYQLLSRISVIQLSNVDAARPFCGDKHLQKTHETLFRGLIGAAHDTTFSAQPSSEQNKNSKVYMTCSIDSEAADPQHLHFYRWVEAMQECGSITEIRQASHGFFKANIVHECAPGYCVGSQCTNAKQYTVSTLALPQGSPVSDSCDDCSCAALIDNCDDTKAKNECRNEYASIDIEPNLRCDYYGTGQWMTRQPASAEECKLTGTDCESCYHDADRFKFRDTYEAGRCAINTNTTNMRLKTDFAARAELQWQYTLADNAKLTNTWQMDYWEQLERSGQHTREICIVSCPVAGSYQACDENLSVDQCLWRFNPGSYHTRLHESPYTNKCKYCRVGTQAACQQSSYANNKLSQVEKCYNDPPGFDKANIAYDCADVDECATFKTLNPGKDLCTELGYPMHTCHNLLGSAEQSLFENLEKPNHRYTGGDTYARFMCKTTDALTNETKSAVAFMAPNSKYSCEPHDGKAKDGESTFCLGLHDETIASMRHSQIVSTTANHDPCTTNHKYVGKTQCVPCPKHTLTQPSKQQPYPTICLGEAREHETEGTAKNASTSGIAVGVTVAVLFVIVIIVSIAKVHSRTNKNVALQDTPSMPAPPYTAQHMPL